MWKLIMISAVAILFYLFSKKAKRQTIHYLSSTILISAMYYDLFVIFMRLN